MSTILPNGTVMPHGLLGLQGHEANIAAFNQSYKNTGLKAGFVVASYAADDEENKSGLCTEYDVITIEQSENKGSTSILYRNCLSSQSFGAIADFLEYTLREETYQNNDGYPTFSDQDGAVVLLQCLDNIGDKAIVVGCLIHPDRETNITSTEPQLSGEYNGVNIEIENDGACSLTFQGATDSDGEALDDSQGDTEFRIETDGSFQFEHDSITIRADRDGTLTITTKADTNINVGGNANIDVTGDATTTVGGNAKTDVTGNSDLTIGGDSTVTVTGNSDLTVNGDTKMTTTGKTTVKSAIIEINGNLSGIITANGTFNVVDFITGVPVLPSPTTFGDV